MSLKYLRTITKEDICLTYNIYITSCNIMFSLPYKLHLSWHFLKAHCMRFLCNGGKSALTPKMLGKSCNVAVPTICIYLNVHSFGGENQY